MANGFIGSNNINVFPCGSRNKNFDPFARLSTEYNLISIINRLVDKDSFIVTTHPKNMDLSNDKEPYIINIKGYLFTISIGVQGIINNLSRDDNGNYIIAEIVTSHYYGNDGNDDSIFQMLSPLKRGNTSLSYDYVEVNSINGYTPISDGSNIYYKENNDGEYTYIRHIIDSQDNERYYKCLQNGDLIISTLNSTYGNEMLDSSDENEFLGIKFYKHGNALVGENRLTIFEKKTGYAQNKDGNFILENGVFKYYEEIPEDTSSEVRYSIIENEGWVEYEDSKIKFKTSKSGDHRSVSIDDGELI